MQRLDIRLQSVDSKLDAHSNSLSDAFKEISRVRTYVDDRIHEGMRDPFANDQMMKPTMTGPEDDDCDIRKETVGNRNRS